MIVSPSSGIGYPLKSNPSAISFGSPVGSAFGERRTQSFGTQVAPLRHCGLDLMALYSRAGNSSKISDSQCFQSEAMVFPTWMTQRPSPRR